MSIFAPSLCKNGELKYLYGRIPNTTDDSGNYVCQASFLYDGTTASSSNHRIELPMNEDFYKGCLTQNEHGETVLEVYGNLEYYYSSSKKQEFYYTQTYFLSQNILTTGKFPIRRSLISTCVKEATLSDGWWNSTIQDVKVEYSMMSLDVIFSNNKMQVPIFLVPFKGNVTLVLAGSCGYKMIYSD